VVKGSGQSGVEDIKSAAWIETVAVSNNEFVLALQRELDDGESEAIALALEKKADLLLMDERLGREVAQYFGIRCVGMLGILTEAKHRGEIEAVKPILDLLRGRAAYRISDELYQRVLHEVGEL